MYLSHCGTIIANILANSVTGGTGHLALSSARALLEHGCPGMALFDLDPAQSQKSVDDLQREFPTAKIITKKVDVSDSAVVDNAVEEAAAELGSLHILLCFAGVVACAHAEELTPKLWQRTMDINAGGTWYCAQAVGKYGSPPSNSKFTNI